MVVDRIKNLVEQVCQELRHGARGDRRLFSSINKERPADHSQCSVQPGSGKSTAVQTVVQMAIDQGAARVGIACPTRMLVARIKEKFPHYDVDSIHAMFELFKPEHLTLDSHVVL